MAELTGERGLRARIAAAFDAEAIHLWIDVADPEHINAASGSMIWAGDAVQIGVDARGTGTRGGYGASDRLPPGSLYATVALAAGHSSMFAHLRPAPHVAGSLTTPTSVIRDDGAGVTRYHVVLPWALLDAAAGVGEAFGLGVQVNDVDAAGHKQRLSWGDSPAGTLQVARLARLELGAPPAGETVRAVQITAPTRYLAGDPWRIDFAFTPPFPAALSIAWGARHVVLPLPGSPPTAADGRSLGRLTLEAFGGPTEEAAGEAAAVSDANRSRPVDSDNAARPANTACGLPARACAAEWPVTVAWLEPPGAAAAAPARSFTLADLASVVPARLQALAAAAGAAAGPLTRLHLRALHGVFAQSWAAATATEPTDGVRAAELFAALPEVPDAAAGAAFEARAARGAQRFLVAFTSHADSSLQPYAVRLPRRRAASSAPAVVFLHGKGDPRITEFAASVAATADDDTAADAHAVIVQPWGRGNLYYTGLAEADVLDALADATERFQLDPDRIGLAGFSMGGAGAWALGLHAPALWSGVAISSGGTWLTPLGVGLGANARGLPFRLWHGADDGAVPPSEMALMREELARGGAAPEAATLAPGVGHAYPDDHAAATLAWLTSKRRRRPSRFIYVVDGLYHRGTRGIALRLDARLAAYPRVICEVQPGRVTLTTAGTDGLDVALGADGLGLQGPLAVIWNGRQVYSGLPKRLSLGRGAGTRPTDGWP